MSKLSTKEIDRFFVEIKMVESNCLKGYAILILVSINAFATEPDWRSYAEVLQFVRPGAKNNVKLSLVDYEQLKINGKLDVAYQQLSKFPVASLSSKEEKLAFYINAYNILALKTVLDHWPIDSIKNVGSSVGRIWGNVAGNIDGREVTLNEIEHKVLRPLAEPRIHFAIVCASVSCPDLRNEPYTASKLNVQLDGQVEQFLSNPNKGLRVGAKAIQLSANSTGMKTILILLAVLKHLSAVTARNCPHYQWMNISTTTGRLTASTSVSETRQFIQKLIYVTCTGFIPAMSGHAGFCRKLTFVPVGA